MGESSQTSQKDTFHLEEYKALRAEVLLLKQHQFAIQKWVIVSLGIIYGLAFGVTAEKGIHIIPAIDKKLLFGAGFAISIVGAGFYAVSDYTMRNISEYVSKIEHYFASGEDPKGWENFQGFATERHPIWGVHKNPYWWAVLLFSTALALYGLRYE